MKRKWNLVVNIGLVCLCLFAIVIGVYSAKTATMEVGGTVGFEAHDLNVTVAVQMYGHAKTPSGTPETTPQVVQTEKTVTDGMEIKLNTFYFTDMESDDDSTEPIVVEFKYVNKSPFEVLAKVTTATTSICNNSAITTEVENAYMPVGFETSSTTDTMKVTFTLATGTKSFSTGATVSMNISLEKTNAKKNTIGNAITVNKYTTQEQKEIWEYMGGYANDNFGTAWVYGLDKCYAEQFPYYITMGKKGTTDLKWLVVGYKNNGALATLTTDDMSALSAGILLENNTYVVLSQESLKEMEFIARENYGDSYVNIKPGFADLGVSATDYYASDVREYLNSYTFKTDNTLTSIDITIKPRAVSELYADMPETYTDGKFSTTESVTGEDEFWLLSKAELITLLADVYSTHLNMDTYLALMSSHEINDVVNNNFLRSFNESKNSYRMVAAVYSYGALGLTSISFVNSVRPACQI